jgi:lipopolysaccharide export system protein LptA
LSSCLFTFGFCIVCPCFVCDCLSRGQTITYKARADNTTAKSKKTRGQTITYKARADNTTAKSKKTRGQTITYKARADNTMAKSKKTRGQTITYKARALFVLLSFYFWRLYCLPVLCR